MAVVEAHCRQASKTEWGTKGVRKEKEKTQREKERHGEGGRARLATRPDRPADLWRQYLPPERQERAQPHWLPTLNVIPLSS